MPADDEARPLTASERLAAALGRPASEPLNEAEAQAFEADLDSADAETRRYWITGNRSAA